jgi:hypothetical protein
MAGQHVSTAGAPTQRARLKAQVQSTDKKGRKAHIPYTGEPPARDAKGRILPGSKMGRPAGREDDVPRGVKASVRAIFEKLVSREAKTIEDATVQGIRSGPRNADRYLRLVTEYVDGKPQDHLSLSHKFDQDELGLAREQLGKKLNRMLAIALKKQAANPEEKK